MFTEEDAVVIFGNIEELYAFHKNFLKDLQAAIQLDSMETSLVGHIFLKYVSTHKKTLLLCQGNQQIN